MRAKAVALTLSCIFLGCSSSGSPAAGPSDGGTTHPTADAGPTAPTDTAAETARSKCAYDAGALAVETQGTSAPSGAAIPIDTIVVVMMENRSFDHYFQDLPNEGWSAGDGGPGASPTSVDVAPVGASNPGIDDAGVPLAHGTQLCFADTNHGWDGTHQEINNGKMDGFAVANDGTHEDPMLGPPDFLSGARAMTYYTKADLPFMYWAAENFAIGDRYFASVPGPTYPNREYLYAASSFGETTTSLAYLPTSVPSGTVLDSLDAKGVAWKAYTDGIPTFFLFRSDKNESGYGKNQGTMSQFTADAMANKLPPVVFIDPNFLSEGYEGQDEHPPAVMQVGQSWLAGITKTLMASAQWAHMAFFLLYDEHGGLYDHVPPPPACPPDAIQPILSTDAGAPYGGFDEYGVRLPFVVFSPYAKRHYVSHKVFDHTSVLRFIEARFDLPALTKRDANALAPWDVFDFKAAPNLTAPAIPDVPVDQATLDQCKSIFTAADVMASPYAN
jgi:phospholipase C